jgi:hypothetical protein
LKGVHKDHRRAIHARPSADPRLAAAPSLFPQPMASVPLRKVPPDYAAIHQQLQKPHVTSQLLWEEYQEDAEGSVFCRRYTSTLQSLRNPADCFLDSVYPIMLCVGQVHGVRCESGRPGGSIVSFRQS